MAFSVETTQDRVERRAMSGPFIRPTLNHDAVDFVDGDRIDRPVVELRHLRRHAPGDRRRPGTCGSRSKAAAQIKAFEDTWRWDETAARANADAVVAGGRVSQAFRTFLGETDMLAYLARMAPRLMKIRRVRLSVMVNIVFPFRNMSTKSDQAQSEADDSFRRGRGDAACGCPRGG